MTPPILFTWRCFSVEKISPGSQGISGPIAGLVLLAPRAIVPPETVFLYSLGLYLVWFLTLFSDIQRIFLPLSPPNPQLFQTSPTCTPSVGSALKMRELAEGPWGPNSWGFDIVTAITWVRALAWELPRGMGAAIKRKKRKDVWFSRCRSIVMSIQSCDSSSGWMLFVEVFVFFVFWGFFCWVCL